MNINQMKESKYLKKEDFGQTGRNMVIAGLKHEDVSLADKPEEMKYILYFNGEQKGMVLNQTNIQLIAHAAGSTETDDWKGKTVNVYEDPTVMFAGEMKGGLRVRPATTAQAPVTNGTTQPEQGFDDSLPPF